MANAITDTRFSNPGSTKKALIIQQKAAGWMVTSFGLEKAESRRWVAG
jgi:hypothetical protein